MVQENEFIPYGRQVVDEDDIREVVRALRSDWLTQGPIVEEFEEAFAAFTGAEFAVALNSGTAGLALACRVAGLGRGDRVATSPITFAASANCALYVEADPVFVDVDPHTANLDPENLKEHLKNKSALRGVIPVHYGGLPCNMPEIYSISQKFGLVIIEDACHALGATYQDPKTGETIKVGSCRHSHMTVFSFHPVKHMTTGEGGMVTTNDRELYNRLQLFRSHGITRDPKLFKNQEMREKYAGQVVPGYYEMQELGFNFRLPDINCALGLSQLKKIDEFVQARRQIAQWYREELGASTSIRLPGESDASASSYHLYPVRIPFDRLGQEREKVMQKLHDRGIGTQVHYIPVHSHPYYQRIGYDSKTCPCAWDFYKECLSLPMFASLTRNQIRRVGETLVDVLGIGGDA
ncbi:MAG: UDP-4-amino-4,6-dideoxy-N-acetyl-beta-L-altrosamine transaminase [Desulfatibacillum sp.]|nr:UDP-4-amino-4,6-dideoxy-N-acetyl-beta-L-altrosamine transaminase [Desulfatibacillum sp.]